MLHTQISFCNLSLNTMKPISNLQHVQEDETWNLDVQEISILKAHIISLQ